MTEPSADLARASVEPMQLDAGSGPESVIPTKEPTAGIALVGR